MMEYSGGMALVASRPSAGTAASLIASNTVDADSEGDYRARRFLLKNVTASAPVFLGGSAVTTGTGLQWDVSDGPLEIELEPGEELYGVVATTAQTVHVLRSGR